MHIIYLNFDIIIHKRIKLANIINKLQISLKWKKLFRGKNEQKKVDFFVTEIKKIFALCNINYKIVDFFVTETKKNIRSL